MNKLLKSVLFVFISASLFGAGFLTAYKIVKKDKEIVSVVKDRFAGQTPAHMTGIGRSMEPTLLNGERHEIYKIEPEEGDVISLDCDKAIGSSETGKGIAKRLIKIREDGAWWILGDNREHSYDSADYGWILPSERSNVWVVKVN